MISERHFSSPSSNQFINFVIFIVLFVSFFLCNFSYIRFVENENIIVYMSKFLFTYQWASFRNISQIKQKHWFGHYTYFDIVLKTFHLICWNVKALFVFVTLWNTNIIYISKRFQTETKLKSTYWCSCVNNGRWTHPVQ